MACDDGSTLFHCGHDDGLCACVGLVLKGTAVARCHRPPLVFLWAIKSYVPRSATCPTYSALSRLWSTRAGAVTLQMAYHAALKHRLGVRLPRLVSFFDMVRTTCSVSSEICFLSSCTSPASTTAGDCVWSLSIAINSRARSTALSSDFASSEALSCLLTAREVPLEIGAAEADHVHRCQCQA